MYREDELSEKYEKVKKFLLIKRLEGDGMRGFLFRYDRISFECKGVISGGMFEVELKGCHLLTQAGLREEQKQMVPSGAGKEKMEYRRVKEILMRILGSFAGRKMGTGEWIAREIRAMCPCHRSQ